MRRNYRHLREEAYTRGFEEFDRLVVDPSFRDFVCLYVAEGDKRNRNRVAICNSDDVVLKLAVFWMRQLNVKLPSFSIQYHAVQNLEALREFWGETLAGDAGEIRFQRKSNSGKLGHRQWRSCHGVLTAFVYDTYFRARLQAWIDRLKFEWTRRAG